MPVPHGREFGRLAETFNRMARDLRRNQEQLVEQERLRKELEIGRRIQEELLPRGPLRSRRSPRSGGVSIPAREVGGDFFNYFPLRSDEVAILVGDVSGKGVRAALLMANLQATIRARLALERDLARLVDALDHEMGSDEPLAPYYTLFLAILEGRTGRLRYVNAGHNTQFVLRRGTAPSGSPRPAARRASTRAAATRSATTLRRRGRALPVHRRPRRGRGRDRRALRHGAPRGAARGAPGERPRPAPRPGRRRGARATGAALEAADDATMVALRYSSRALAGPAA